MFNPAFLAWPLLALALLPLSVSAQDEEVAEPAQDTTYWKKSMMFGVNFNQATFSDNWKAGGVNSVALGGLFNTKANYLKGKVSFDNEFDVQYGIVKNQGQSTRKNADRLFFDSKVGYGLSEKWAAFANVNFLSQVAPGYRYEKDANDEELPLVISRFMSPAFLTNSVGFEYKPVDYFFLRLGVWAGRQTFVLDTGLYVNEPSNYGVEIGKKVRNEFLSQQIVAGFDKDIMKNVNLKWRYVMFVNYENFSFDAIDHRLDATLTAKVNKYINTNLSLMLLYDKDQDTALQWGQVLALGLAVKLPE